MLKRILVEEGLVRRLTTDGSSLPAQVAVPLPQPIGYAAADEYKLQLTFDGEGGWLEGPVAGLI